MNILKKIPLILFILVLTNFVFAANRGGARLLAISQGTSLPTTYSLLNFSGGWSFVNPAGVVNYNNPALSLQYDQNGNSGIGLEIGVGGSWWGVAGGYSTRNCTGCNGTARVALGFGFSSVDIGFRFENELSGVGLLFNPQGTHRWGLTAQLNDPAGSNNNISTLGFGYGYVAGSWEFALDASKRIYEDQATTENRLYVSPGVLFYISSVSLSLNYETLLNDTANQNTSTENGSFWFGFNIDKNSWNLSVYIDYQNEIALDFTTLF
ncbi:MAG: hypothetical protein KDD50_06990 [Bdellovibrionales bacterium]|nr:hypothetical protein [Bdellovibrionales bacterium]